MPDTARNPTYALDMTKLAKRKFFKPKSFGFWVQVIASIAALIIGAFELRSYLLQPDVVYATNEMVAYAVGVEKKDTDDTPVVPYVIFGAPPKILALVVQNDGERTASDVLVRIPFSAGDKLVAAWMRRGDRPTTDRMNADVFDYKFDKLVPGESVSFYIYLENTESDLAKRITVFDGFGQPAPHHEYMATLAGDDRLRINVPRNAYYIFGLLIIIFLIPDIFGRIRQVGERVLR